MNNKHLIKKINFNNYLISYNDILKKIEKNIEVELNLYKKNLRKKFNLFFIIAIFTTYYSYWFIYVPIYIISFWYLYKSSLKNNLLNSEIREIENILVEKEFKNQLNIYKKELGIINYIPTDLEYENLGLITTDGNNYENAEENLIKKAFNLKADGIININFNSTSTTKIKGNIKKGNGVISSDVNIKIHLQGMAIKLI